MRIRAESDTADFTELRVALPRGTAPDDVTLDEAPKGWKLKAAADGYTVGGPALKTGVDAEHKIKVRQLPDAKDLGSRRSRPTATTRSPAGSSCPAGVRSRSSRRRS
jgi:hypothetical protein